MNLKFIKNTCIIMGMLIISSCSDFLNVNDDPNNPTDVNPEVVLAVAQASVGGVVGGDLNIVGGLWSQHWTCLLYTSPSPRDRTRSRMPSSS